MYARHRFDSDVAAPVSADDALGMETAVARAARLVASLDLAVINHRMMTMEEGPKWTKAQADFVETRYRRFLQMAILYPDIPLAPAHDIDQFWHEHILNTRAYFKDCETLFGQYLHHNAGFGAAKEEYVAKAAYNDQTASIYLELFGEDFLGASTEKHCVVWTCVVSEGSELTAARH